MLKLRAIRVERDQECPTRYSVRVRLAHAGDVQRVTVRVDGAKNTNHAVKLALREAIQTFA